MGYHLTGLSITDFSQPIRTFDQLQGHGEVRNKALVIPAHVRHLNPAIQSIEYVSVLPGAKIGEHLQMTDEIYLVRGGTGTLFTNGTATLVQPGSLAIAPKGTRHALENADEGHSLDFLVIEVVTSTERHLPALTHPPLLEHLQETDQLHPTYVGKDPVAVRAATVDLPRFFTGPWGRLTLIEIPPGGRVEFYRETGEENLFLFEGNMTLQLDEERFDSEDTGFNAFLPANLPRKILNRSSVAPLLLASVLFNKGGQNTDA